MLIEYVRPARHSAQLLIDAVLILEVYELKGFYLDNRYVERKECDLV